MKKRIRFIITGLIISLASSLGINLIIKKASAYNGINGPEIHAEFDSSAAIFYSDPAEQSSIDVTDMDALNDGYFTFDDSNATLQEVSGNKFFRATLFPVRFYVNLDAHMEVSFTQFSIKIIADKISTSGSAASIMELFSQKPSLINGNGNNTLSGEYSLARCHTTNSSESSALYTIENYTFSNNSNDNQNIYLSGIYYIAHIVKYASSVDHISLASVGIDKTYCTRYAEIGDEGIKIDFDDDNALYYQQSGSDLSSINVDQLSSIPTTNNVYTTNYENDTYVIKEAALNNYYDIILIPFRFYLSVSPYETVSYESLHINLTIRKLGNGGTAGAFSELFDGEPYTLNTSSNDGVSNGGLIRKYSINAVNDETNIFARNMVECDLSGESFVNSNNQTMNIYSNQVFYLMLGCRFASTYLHQAEATIQVTGVKGTNATEYVCRIGNTYYENITDAIASGKSTLAIHITLLKDLTTANTVFPIAPSKRSYINLNSYSINSGNSVAFSTSSYIDFYGSGLIVSSAVHTFESTTNIVFTANSDIEVRNNYSGAETSVAFYSPSGNLTINAGSIIGGDYGIWFTGNVITINGGTVSGNLYSVYTSHGLNIGGATTTVPTIYQTAIDSLRINLSGGSSVYSNTNSTITVTLKNNEDITIEKVVFAGIASTAVLDTLHVTNGVSTGLEFYYDANQSNYETRFTPRNIIFNGTNCTLTGNTTAHYGAQYNGTIVPDTGYTYPASIEILMGSEPLASSQYSYKANTGSFNIYKNVILDVITINAVAVSATYQITFSSNGGSGTMDKLSGGYNEVVILPSCSFTRNYRTFLEWNTLSNGSGVSYSPGDEYTITANTTLYAIWYESNENKVDYFVTNYLRMSTYTQGDGSCLGENGYYAQAKAALIALGNDCITLFRENSKYQAPKERYETWAAFNNDMLHMYEDTPVNAISKSVISNAIANNNIVVIIVVITVLCVSSMFFYIKRRNNA